MLWVKLRGEVLYSDNTKVGWTSLSTISDVLLQDEIDKHINGEVSNPIWLHILNSEKIKRRDIKLEKLINNLK